MTNPHRVVIVGGGAGGLELGTRAGDRFGRRGRATVTLVDKNETHLWKPLLHEVAAGSMDIHAHQLDYLAQARWHHFTFCYGALESVDRTRREIAVAPTVDERGVEVIPRRTDRKSTRLNSSHGYISYAVFCLKKKKKTRHTMTEPLHIPA